MRTIILVIAALALVACDSGTVPSPADRQNARTESEPVNEELIALHGEGLVIGAEAFYFAAGRSEVEGALESRLGNAMQATDASQCGARAIASSTFPGGLTVNFQQGNLAGWTLSEASEAIQVEADISIGTPRDEAEALPGFTAMAESALGEEFALGDRLGGFIQDGAVTTLYAGAQCFVR